MALNCEITGARLESVLRWIDVGGGKLPPAKKAGWVLFRKVATPGYGNAEAQLSSLLEAIVYRGTSEGPHGARLVASSSMGWYLSRTWIVPEAKHLSALPCTVQMCTRNPQKGTR